MSERIPAIVLGGTGYVAGELLRLIAGHSQLELRAVASDSQPGEPLAKLFPHLRPVYPELAFSSQEEVRRIVAELPRSAVLSAAPHGVSATMIDDLLKGAAASGARPRVVDISADFRYGSAEAYESVYRKAHAAPDRIADFTCAVPEHLPTLGTPHVAHPGCFATAILLASVPLLALDLVEPRLFVAGVTGSTGSGRTPTAGTHHPQRHSDLYAYSPLAHRHAPEVAALAAASSGVAAEFHFVPHSGPFARGIHVTVQASARRPLDTARLLDALSDYYGDSRFIHVSRELPRVKDVVASNHAFLGGAASGGGVAVMCAIDNLVKGAAGGAVQWINRMFGLDAGLGLGAPAPGWT